MFRCSEICGYGLKNENIIEVVISGRLSKRFRHCRGTRAIFNIRGYVFKDNNITR